MTDRAQSHGAEISSRQDQLHRVRVRAHHMPAPSDLAIRVCLLELQSRGLSLSHDAAADLLQTFAAAEEIGRQELP
jgi:hypothetical protein